MKLLNYLKIYPKKQDFILLLKKITVFYIIILTVLFFTQRYIMYFPDKDISISSHWIPITNAHQKIIALKEKDNDLAYNVLIFHGNAGNANMKNYYKLLFPYANIIIAEYPGFGFRSSETISKSHIIEASREIVEKVLKDKKPLIIVGESLGSAIASEMAVQYHIKNLVLATPYNDIASVAQSKFPLLPVYPLVLDRYNNTEVLKNFDGNIVLLIAQFDQVIPNKFAYLLSQSLRPDIRKLEILIEKSSHNSYVSYFSEDDRKKMHNFLHLSYH